MYQVKTHVHTHDDISLSSMQDSCITSRLLGISEADRIQANKFGYIHVISNYYVFKVYSDSKEDVLCKYFINVKDNK